MGWEWRQGSFLEYLTIPEWEAHRIQIGFSSRKDGVSAIPYKSLNLGLHVKDNPENVLENRDRGFRSWRVACDFALGNRSMPPE